MMDKHYLEGDIVIVGGGVAGLEIATTLGRKFRRQSENRRILLVDADSAHVWKPMLHTIAAGTRDTAQHQTPYLAQARDAGFTYVPGALAGLQRATKEIEVAALRGPNDELILPERRIRYGTLIVAIGSRANDRGVPGAQTHCMRIDSRREAEAFSDAIRMRMLQSLARDEALPIAIVGGGATGVELAAELAKLREIAASYGEEKLRSGVQISLIESGQRLLPSFPEDIGQATRARLESVSVRVMTGRRVEAAEERGLRFKDGGWIDADLKVWAAGVKAPGVLAGLDGLETNQANQLMVLPTLQTTLDPTIFAVGDCASLVISESKRGLPPTAQVAHQQARHLCAHLPRLLSNNVPIPAFRYRDFGALVSLADYDAFASLGRLGLLREATFRGTLARLSHGMLYRAHQARLHGPLRGTLLWCIDALSSMTKAPARMS
jgi:NADH:ubiquinone reductase (H+-translocating)